MGNLDQCRDIKELNVLAQVMLTVALEDIKKQGVSPLVIETYRTQDRQNWLYAQGRTRDLKQPIITWTLNSIHTRRNAVDLVPQRGGSPIWNSKDKDTLTVIKTMVKYGWEAGANWSKNADSPHFQIANVTTLGIEFTKTNTNAYVTKAIQRCLNEKNKAGIIEDGSWGTKTTLAINNFKKINKFANVSDGKLGLVELTSLLK